MNDEQQATIDSRPHGPSGIVVAVRGEVDGANVADLERAVAAAARGADPLVVDLSAVEYIDSQGLRWIATMAADAQAASRRLVIVAAANGFAAHVLELAGMTTSLDVREAVPLDGEIT